MSTKRRAWIVLGGVAALFLWLFAGVLVEDEALAFRDAAHCYYPLFQYCQDEWAAGRPPLWNPYDNLGQPLAADGISSVFYPGKLLFWLPLPYAWLYKAYVLLHLLLAAWAAYRAARHWQASVPAAGLCALSYAFCGNVLLNIYNVVFLVGAAWLPLALSAADRMLTERRLSWAAAFGLTLALMVLGGDPQMAYNAGLLAALDAFLLWRAAAGSPLVLRGFLTWRPTLLAVAAAAAFLFSAVQVLPSWEFADRSNRADAPFDHRLRGQLERRSHLEEVYQFSVGPWRLAEMVWPNVAGQQFPVHRRWLSAFRLEGRVWTPTLYMGLVPLLLALSAFRLRSGAVSVSSTPQTHAAFAERTATAAATPAATADRWLSWAALLAVLASFGWFGIGFVWNDLSARVIDALSGPIFGGPATAAADGEPSVGEALGGVYWLMVLVLPGYAQFRYPAKLLVVAALALSVLAARGLDRELAAPSRRLRATVLMVWGLSLAGLLIFAPLQTAWETRFASVRVNNLFGPLDAAGAWRDVLWALGQTAVLATAAWWLFQPAHGSRSAAWRAWAVLGLTALDLAVAMRWTVVSVPSSVLAQPSPLGQAVRELDRGQLPAPARFVLEDWWAASGWREGGASARMFEVCRGARLTLRPKHHLAERVAMLDAEPTMTLADYGAFGGRVYVNQLADCRVQLAQQTTYRALAEAVADPAAVRAMIEADPARARFPRLWVAQRAQRIDPLVAEHGRPSEGRIDRVLLAVDRRMRSLRGEPIVECAPEQWKAARSAAGLPPEDAPSEAAPPNPADDTAGCRITHFDPSRIEADVQLDRPGLLVLCEQFYPGWRAMVVTGDEPPREVPLLRTNGVMRGVWLPPGRHQVTYVYRPATFFWGANLSLLAWTGLAIVAATVLSRRLRRPRRVPTTAELRV